MNEEGGFENSFDITFVNKCLNEVSLIFFDHSPSERQGNGKKGQTLKLNILIGFCRTEMDFF